MEENYEEVKEYIRVASTDPGVIKYSTMINDAAKIREESFDNVAADATSKTEEGQQGYINYADYYRKDIMESAEESCKKHGFPKEAAYPVYLLLTTAWNNILDWSDEQLGIERKEGGS